MYILKLMNHVYAYAAKSNIFDLFVDRGGLCYNAFGQFQNDKI